jgi:Dolichyl-phosphate-mannose-protein mannosyltransferase
LSNPSKSRLPALVCAIVLLLCALATYPVAETGMNDEFSYIKSAQVLAQTGHIVYNGWATAMLGWQLWLGALFAKLFGPSFTAIRASTLFVALLTVFLIQRTLVRAGVNSRNATIGTLAVALSPLFLPLALSFMTDIGGLFFIVLCLYACLRAVQAESDRAALGWLIFAALSNAVGGTVRQIAWLGALVMIPCTVWLLRRRRHAVVVGAVLYVVSGAIIFGSLHWFQLQPYSVPEPLIPGHFARHNFNYLVGQTSRMFFDFAMFLIPFLLAFLPAISIRNRRSTIFLSIGVVVSAAAGYLFYRRGAFESFLAPYKGNYFTLRGLVDATELRGSRPVLLTPGLQLLLTAAVFLALLCFLSFFLFSPKRRVVGAGAPGQSSWYVLLVLLGPFTMAYLTLLLPRAAFGGLWDRYLVPLNLIAILLLLRLFQDYVRPRLPVLTVGLVAVAALFTIAGTHDAFSLYRGIHDATAELNAAGIPATSIDGGFEQNGMTQIERFGYINDPRIRVPRVVFVDQASPFPESCMPQLASTVPAVGPGYAISFTPAACGGVAPFAPVIYHQWLGEHAVPLYIVKTFKP